jgi:hypothetical protein
LMSRATKRSTGVVLNRGGAALRGQSLVRA